MGDGHEENIGQVPYESIAQWLALARHVIEWFGTSFSLQLLMEDVGRFGLQEDILNMHHEEATDDEDERWLMCLGQLHLHIHSDVPTYNDEEEPEERQCRGSAMQPAVAALLGEAIITHAKGNTPDAIRMIMEVVREGASPWCSRLSVHICLQHPRRPTRTDISRPCTATAARRPSAWSLPGSPHCSTRSFNANRV